MSKILNFLSKKKPSLEKKIAKSKEIILGGVDKYGTDEMAIAWTGGKDSTVVLHLIREIYGGKVPMQVFFNDSTLEFPEVTKFVKRLSREWDLDLIKLTPTPVEANRLKSISLEKQASFSRELKIRAIKRALKKFGFNGFLVGIRWDEHPSRSKETYFSSREGHVRIHPILHFTEDDVWDYIKKFSVPYVSLYDQGYRSLGEAPFTKPSQGEGERSGREADKEKVMERLRSLGYW